MHRRPETCAWNVDVGRATPESVFWNRRRFLKAAGIAGLGVAATRCGLDPAAMMTESSDDVLSASLLPPAGSAFTPGDRNAAFAVDRPVTDERVAAANVNFFEFSADKRRAWSDAQALTVRPWTLEVAGLVNALQRIRRVRRTPVHGRRVLGSAAR